MATSTMDNASAQLAIALRLRELEASGTVDKIIIRLQRQQLEIDSGFDAVTFEASRRLALSMAKAVKEDSVLLAQSTLSPQIDDATFHHLAPLNHPLPRHRTVLSRRCSLREQIRHCLRRQKAGSRRNH